MNLRNKQENDCSMFLFCGFVGIVRKDVVPIIMFYTSVAKAMKALRKLGCCLQIEVGMVVIKLFCLVKS